MNLWVLIGKVVVFLLKFVGFFLRVGLGVRLLKGGFFGWIRDWWRGG
jgi:hypothetical protein